MIFKFAEMSKIIHSLAVRFPALRYFILAIENRRILSCKKCLLLFCAHKSSFSFSWAIFVIFPYLLPRRIFCQFFLMLKQNPDPVDWTGSSTLVGTLLDYFNAINPNEKQNTVINPSERSWLTEYYLVRCTVHNQFLRIQIRISIMVDLMDPDPGGKLNRIKTGRYGYLKRRLRSKFKRMNLI